MITRVDFPAKEIRHFHRCVLPLMHTITTSAGIKMPSPVTLCLADELGYEIFDRISNIDLEFRNAKSLDAVTIEYQPMMELYYGMLMMLHYGITHYGEMEQLYRNPPKKLMFSMAYFDMIHDRLVVRYDYIKELVRRNRNAKVSSADNQMLYDEIKLAFVDVDDDYKLVDAILTKGYRYYRDSAIPLALFQIYQAVLEIKIYKNSILNDGKKNAIEGAVMDSILNLARNELKKLKELAGVDAQGEWLVLLELEAKVNFYVKHELDKAIELIAEADALLAQVHQADTKEYKLIKAGIVSQHIHFLSTKISVENKERDSARLMEVLELALTVKPALEHARPNSKELLFNTSIDLLKKYVACLKRDLKRATQETCVSLQTAVLSATKYLGLIKALSCDQIQADLVLQADKMQAELSALLKSARDKKLALHQAELNEAKNKAELEKKQAEYEQQFEQLLAQFPEKCKEAIIERSNRLPVQSARIQEVPNASALPLPVTEEPSVESVSRASLAFFATHGLNEAEVFVAEQADENKAEAMLYVGDKFLLLPRVEEALSWYERAIVSLNQQKEVNASIEESIKMMLEVTRQLLLQQLAISIQRQKNLEASLYQRIINWGLDVCRQQGMNPKILGMRNKTSEAIIYEAGWKEYIRRGQVNKQGGRMPSMPALERQALKVTQESIRDQLEKTDHLMQSIKRPDFKPQDFPSLNTASALFSGHQKKLAKEVVHKAPSQQCV